ncbi:MAG: hypothetical protein ACJ76P_02570 [Actinomycetota bacterium]|jgi:hypothetical protein
MRRRAVEIASGHRFSTMEQAHAFIDSPDLHDGMQQAGDDLSGVRLEFRVSSA